MLAKTLITVQKQKRYADCRDPNDLRMTRFVSKYTCQY
jgi:hypothetical protein